MAYIPRKRFPRRADLDLDPIAADAPNATSERSAGMGGDFFGGVLSAPGFGLSTLSGTQVDEISALTATAVYNAVTLISSALASLDLYVCEKTNGGGRRPAPDHRAYDAVHATFNDIVTAFIGRQTVIGHTCLHGNGYLEVERRRNDLRLHVIDPRNVRPKLDKRTGILRYDLTAESDSLPSDKVIHFKMWSYDGIEGASPVRLAHEAIGLYIAREKWESALMGNNANVGGALEVPGITNEVQKEQLQQKWDSKHAGTENAGKTALLVNGVKWVNTQLSPEKLLLTEARLFSIAEVARLWNIPQHMLGNLERATFANIEEQNIQFLQYTLTPWIAMIEAELNRKLFTPQERTRYCVWHDAKPFLRANAAAKTAQDAADFASGKKSINELRLRDGDNPLDHPNFNLHFIPGNNLVAVESLPPADAEPLDEAEPDASTESPEPVNAPDDTPEPVSVGMLNSLRSALVDVLGRWETKSDNAVARMVRRPTAAAEIADFYRSHATGLGTALAPILALGSAASRRALAFDTETFRDARVSTLRDLITTVPPDEFAPAWTARRESAEAIAARILEPCRCR